MKRYMQTITLYLPKDMEAQKLRQDLEETISRYRGKFMGMFPFELPLRGSKARVYKITTQGSVVTLTNDLNVFSQKHFMFPAAYCIILLRFYFWILMKNRIFLKR